LHPSVRDAIAAARQRGITVLLVTGRILSELERVAGSLHVVDAVVAENGAVLHFPPTGRTTLLSPPMPERFIREIQRRGIPFQAGRCLVDADAAEAPRLLDVIRTLELPLVLVFNGGRVMTLSQGISKATGLHAALETLRLSPRNALAIGDAENDHELLRLAEVGVAVEWGRSALKSFADVVLPGSGPEAVGSFLTPLAATRQLPIPSRARRRLVLGHTDDGAEFSLGVRGRNVLVTGDARSGKSWVAGLLAEQLILHGYCICAIDPEGDYSSLEALPGVTVLGRDDPPPTPRELGRALRYPDRSVIVDLSQRPLDEKIPYVRALLKGLAVLRRKTGLPHRIFVDEAHYYLNSPESGKLLDLDRNGYTIVTYRASLLPRALIDSVEVVIVTCQTDPAEIAALADLCQRCPSADDEGWQLVQRLKVGQAVALPITEETGGIPRMFLIGPRITPHVRHREKYVDVPVSDERAFVFAPLDGGPYRQVQTLRQLVNELESLPPAALEPYVVRGDFSRWIGDVFGDHALAEELHALERRHRLHHREDTLPEIASAIRARYDLVPDELELKG
jgi:hydroxymethylpyrimidine pyrophosphatase-like HAD family hydrolase